MAELIALAFDSEDEADRARETVGDLDDRGAIELRDACVVTGVGGGRMKYDQAHELAGGGLLGGAFWGGLIDLFLAGGAAEAGGGMGFGGFGMGMGMGAAMGALAAQMNDVGIDESFVRAVGSSVAPAGSAVVLLVDEFPDDLVGEFEAGPEVHRTTLSASEEEHLRRSFGLDGVADDEVDADAGNDDRDGENSENRDGGE